VRQKYWERNLWPISLQRVKKYNSEERERNGKERWEEEWEEELEEDIRRIFKIAAFNF
jgi:hypothetical protein